MKHTRGQIEADKDYAGTFYKVYTGCELLDDYYTCDDKKTANRIAAELKGNQS